MDTNPDTLCAHPITRYGVLVDDDTGERLRPATKEEHARARLCAARFTSNCGRILVGERVCHIDPHT